MQEETFKLTTIGVLGINESWFLHKIFGPKMLRVFVGFASLVGNIIVNRLDTSKQILNVHHHILEITEHASFQSTGPSGFSVQKFPMNSRDHLVQST